MKILHINNNYMYSNLHQLMVRNLTAAGVESIVYSPIAYGASGKVTPDDYVTVSECFNRHDRYIFDYKQSKIIKDIEKKIVCDQFDCYHAYTLFTDGNVAYSLSRKYGIPYVVAVRDTDVNSFFKKAPYLRSRGIDILKHAQAVFFLSCTYRDIVLNKYVPQALKEEIGRKTYVIPNGIDAFWLDNKYTERDVDSIYKRLTTEHKLKAIYVGAVSKRKNASTTVKALRLLQKQGWETVFTVIGDKEDEAEYEEIVRFEGTRYLGRKDKGEIISYLRENDVFIMPSITETFGLSYAEAMSQGVPVIYSIGQGFDGQFKEGEVGYGVDCKSAAEISARIKQLSNEYREVSRNCSELSDKFNWKLIVNQYIQLYIQIDMERKR